jgi:hypothetical protein
MRDVGFEQEGAFHSSSMSTQNNLDPLQPSTGEKNSGSGFALLGNDAIHVGALFTESAATLHLQRGELSAWKRASGSHASHEQMCSRTIWRTLDCVIVSASSALSV